MDTAWHSSELEIMISGMITSTEKMKPTKATSYHTSCILVLSLLRGLLLIIHLLPPSALLSRGKISEEENKLGQLFLFWYVSVALFTKLHICLHMYCIGIPTTRDTHKHIIYECNLNLFVWENNCIGFQIHDRNRVTLYIRFFEFLYNIGGVF